MSFEINRFCRLAVNSRFVNPNVAVSATFKPLGFVPHPNLRNSAHPAEAGRAGV